MALYGLNPTPETKNPMNPVVSLDVPVIRTRIVYKDSVVGYGATYRSPDVLLAARRLPYSRLQPTVWACPDWEGALQRYSRDIWH